MEAGSGAEGPTFNLLCYDPKGQVATELILMGAAMRLWDMRHIPGLDLCLYSLLSEKRFSD